VAIVLTFHSGNGLSYTSSFQAQLIVMTMKENNSQSVKTAGLKIIDNYSCEAIGNIYIEITHNQIRKKK
jgi:hypothetical protein